LAHRTQIASQIWVARRSLTVSQIVQLAALGIAEVIVGRASPVAALGIAEVIVGRASPAA
jgi:hypothetical protein